MIYVGRRDGSTRTYDLLVDGEVGRFAREAEVGEVRSVSLAAAREQAEGPAPRADLTQPRRFRVISYDARVESDRDGKPTAEVVSAVCDGCVVSLTMFLNGRSGRFRVDLDRRGTPRFRPS